MKFIVNLIFSFQFGIIFICLNIDNRDIKVISLLNRLRILILIFNCKKLNLLRLFLADKKKLQLMPLIYINS